MMLDQVWPADSAAAGLSSIRPASTGVFFTPREILKTAQSMRRPSQRSPLDQVSRSWSAGSSSPFSSVNVNLSSIEVEQLLKDKVICRYHDLKQEAWNQCGKTEESYARWCKGCTRPQR